MNYIENLLKRVIDEAADGNPKFCILLESKIDENRWIQLTWDVINAAYPCNEEPLMKLQELKIPLFEDAEVTDWKAGLFATIEHPAYPPSQIAAFISQYVEKVLGVSAEEKDMRIEEQQL